MKGSSGHAKVIRLFLQRRKGTSSLVRRGKFMTKQLLGKMFGFSHESSEVTPKKASGWISKDFLMGRLSDLLGFLLAGAVVFSGCAPFGLAYYAVANQKKRNISLFIATSIGYLTCSGDINPLKYLIALIVLFALKGGLQKSAGNSSYILYLAAGISMFFSGMLFVAVEGFLTYDIMLLCCEILLCCMSAYLFHISTRRLFSWNRGEILSTQEMVSTVLLLSICFLSLSTFKIGDFSIGRSLGVLIILLVAQSGNVSYASMCGMIMGLIMGMSQRDAMTLCAAYGSAALCGAVLAPLGRFSSACSFLLVSGLVSLYSDFQPMSVIWLYEIMVASVVSILVPKRLLALVKSVTPGLPASVNSLHEEKIRNFCSTRLLELSGGLRDVFETVKYISARLQSASPANMSAIIETAADSVCKKCKLSSYCWGRDYDTTMDYLARVFPVFQENGKITSQDFPTDMAVRCIQPGFLIDGLNSAYRSFVLNKKISEKFHSGRNMECNQFIGLADTIEQIAQQLRERITFDSDAEARIIAFFEEGGKHPLGVSVLYYDTGRPKVEIDLSSMADLSWTKAELLTEISALCHVPLGQMVIETKKNHITLVLSQKETYSPIFAQSQAKKDTEDTSGDCGLVFPIYGGRLCMALCDGMGSGKRAAIDSTMSVKVLERVLKSGFDCDMAINSLNAALILNSDEERFASVDLSIIDMFTGHCRILKSGAPPTFVKLGGRVEKLSAKSLPVGILENTAPEYLEADLSKGDMVVMVSDGVIGTEDEAFILEILKNYTGFNMTALSDLILNQAKKRFNNCCPDDMTVISLIMQ
jgi:stage II sporulation protein E